ncbi:MAG: hypothetical protein WBG90_19795 [Saonia sp.]
MKNFIIVLGLLFCLSAVSQQNASKNDIIMTSDGQLLQVKVTKVTESSISFNYPGESVVNEIKSNGVEKIVFASGRTQNFGSAGATTNTSAANNLQADSTSLFPDEIVEAPSYEENQMSIVPLNFKRNGAYSKTLANKATEYVVSLMSGKASTQGIEVLKMGTAIEKLVDGGVNYAKLRQSSPAELRDVLGTEYILYVTIDETQKDAATNSNFVSEIANNNTQLERTINLRLYGADSEVESFEVDFSESIFLKKTVDNSNVLASGKWKSSLRYLTEQLFDSNVFVD